MEETDHEIGEREVLVTAPSAESAALDIIRTETVLSRLPIHNLAKKGNVNIQILKLTSEGKVELKWDVSYSDRYGQARQLAYKLDTIVINRHIDESERPLPKIICLGSLRDIADELGLGGDTNKVRRALRQNASAFITAKFEYPGRDRSRKTLEADFTRYSVVFTGEQLPDGRRADAVYIILNEPYREVLNNAPVRPLDRAYMKELPPAAQRFYELVSYKIFSALTNHYPQAKILYSEYCTFSAQLRHLGRQRAQDQMAKVIRPHKLSGYITAVKYKPTIDSQNQPDWELHLTPGPRAHAEFAIAHGRKPPKTIAASTGERRPKLLATTVPTAHTLQATTVSSPAFAPELVTEFTRRGITERKATEILAKLRPGQDIVAQLEYYDHMIEHAGFRVVNPPGFYIRQIEKNIPVPEGFETSAKRKVREERERKDRERREAEDAQRELEDAYENYCYSAVDHYIAENPTAYQAMLDAKMQEERERYPGSWAGSTVNTAKWGVNLEIRKQLQLPTFEEFVALRKQGTDSFSLKPVAVSDPHPSSVLPLSPTETAEMAPSATVGEEAAPAPSVQDSGEAAAAEPAIVEQVIELVSEPPHEATIDPAPAPAAPDTDSLSGVPDAEEGMEQGLA